MELLFGAIAGLAGGLVDPAGAAHGLMDSPWSQILPVATAALAYGLAAPLGGSGFIAAFVAGFAFGRLHRDARRRDDPPPRRARWTHQQRDLSRLRGGDCRDRARRPDLANRASTVF